MRQWPERSRRGHWRRRVISTSRPCSRALRAKLVMTRRSRSSLPAVGIPMASMRAGSPGPELRRDTTPDQPAHPGEQPGLDHFPRPMADLPHLRVLEWNGGARTRAGARESGLNSSQLVRKSTANEGQSPRLRPAAQRDRVPARARRAPPSYPPAASAPPPDERARGGCFRLFK